MLAVRDANVTCVFASFPWLERGNGNKIALQSACREEDGERGRERRRDEDGERGRERRRDEVGQRGRERRRDEVGQRGRERRRDEGQGRPASQVFFYL